DAGQAPDEAVDAEQERDREPGGEPPDRPGGPVGAEGARRPVVGEVRCGRRRDRGPARGHVQMTSLMSTSAWRSASTVASTDEDSSSSTTTVVRDTHWPRA